MVTYGSKVSTVTENYRWHVSLLSPVKLYHKIVFHIYLRSTYMWKSFYSNFLLAVLILLGKSVRVNVIIMSFPNEIQFLLAKLNGICRGYG